MKIFLIVLLLGMSVCAHSQFIDSITYTPKNPTTADTITVICYVAYPNVGCPVDSMNWYYGSNSFILQAFHCNGPINLLCYTRDTFKLPPTPYPGTYTIYYMPGFVLDTPCTYPMDIHGDPIPYPYAIGQVPVTITLSVGTENISTMSSVKAVAFPNPASSYVTFDYELPSDMTGAEIIISDIQGRDIFVIPIQSPKGQCFWDVTAYTDGLYFWTFKDQYYVLGNGKIFVSK